MVKISDIDIPNPSEKALLKSYVEKFEDKYDYKDGHFVLACHAAFPLIITADLLYKIWLNFNTYNLPEKEEIQKIPYIAVSDLLLSALCKPVSNDRYEMPHAVRLGLLAWLKKNLGNERLEQLADFMSHYIQNSYTENDPYTEAVRNAQQLSLDAYLNPTVALETITDILVKKSDSSAEQLRINMLMERFEKQYSVGLGEKPTNFDTVLQYTRGLRHFHYKKNGEAQKVFMEIPTLQFADPNQKQTGTLLPIPEGLKQSLKNEKNKNESSKLYALIVGINKYQNTNIPTLKGCVADAQDMAQMLSRINPKCEMATLFDEQATSTAISNSLTQLLDKVTPKDSFVFYYAGQADNERLITGELGLDTMFLTYNYLAKLLERYPKIRKNIVVITDSEHVRAFAPEEGISIISSKDNSFEIQIEQSQSKSETMQQSYVQESEDAQTRGAFTYSLTNVLRRNSGTNPGYAELFKEVRNQVRNRVQNQIPLLCLNAQNYHRRFLEPPPNTVWLMQELLLQINLYHGDVNGILDDSTRNAFKDYVEKYKDTATQGNLLVGLQETKKVFLKQQAARPVMVLVLSNPIEEAKKLNLDAEEKALIDIFSDKNIELIILRNPIRQDIVHIFQNPEYRQRIAIFHFAGVERDDRNARNRAVGMLLLDEKTGTDLYEVIEWAALLRYQENMKLVFLNTCYSTLDAELLHQLGVPAVIACAETLYDEYSIGFASTFYKNLAALQEVEKSHQETANQFRVEPSNALVLSLRPKSATVKASSLNTRNAPNPRAEIIRTLSAKEVVTVFETRYEWSRIGTEEWVNSVFLEMEGVVIGIEKILNAEKNMNHKKHLKTLLSEGKLIEAIKELLDATDKNGQKDLNSTLILLSGQYHNNESQIIKGVLSNEEYNRTKNRIQYGVDSLLEDYKEMEGYIFEASPNVVEQNNKSDKPKDIKSIFASPPAKNKTMQKDAFAFKKELAALLDQHQQNAIADILQKIKESGFEYDKVKFKEIQNSLNPMALAMMAQSLVQSTKVLIGTVM